MFALRSLTGELMLMCASCQRLPQMQTTQCCVRKLVRHKHYKPTRFGICGLRRLLLQGSARYHPSGMISDIVPSRLASQCHVVLCSQQHRAEDLPDVTMSDGHVTVGQCIEGLPIGVFASWQNPRPLFSWSQFFLSCRSCHICFGFCRRGLGC